MYPNELMITLPRASRPDEGDDGLFYQQPRLVQHIDLGFIASLQEVFRQYLPENATILDTMSSWVSHLPEDLKTAKVVGHGMNSVELAANPRLDEFFVQNLNQNPKLPLADNTFDAALNTVSIQYLVDAPGVLAEVNRVLKPGGAVIISFSNRMFPTKAVHRWQNSEEEERVDLVQQYLLAAGGYTDLRVHRKLPTGLTFFFSQQRDPFYCVTARKAAADIRG
ncbi:methyltransferase domain-containing protein [Gloeobacter morelensis MG652769]|uniref:Methyltransferase domain-containing protein n=2 Tax=Gloeobacter TaxID=33071 RepID=A0ABY3PTH5_9CYAN|nr:methyltransferase domain-containing protein [Gloeobacter morelensis MG652769]